MKTAVAGADAGAGVAGAGDAGAGAGVAAALTPNLDLTRAAGGGAKYWTSLGNTRARPGVNSITVGGMSVAGSFVGNSGGGGDWSSAVTATIDTVNTMTNAEIPE